jgi:hypothetical protein
MKLALVAAIGALAALTFAASPADAGKKGNKQGHGGSGRVHISPTVTTKNLHKLKGSLPHGNANRRAVEKEIKRRQDIIDDAHAGKSLGKLIGQGGGAAQVIMDIGNWGTALGTRKRGH